MYPFYGPWSCTKIHLPPSTTITLQSLWHTAIPVINSWLELASTLNFLAGFFKSFNLHKKSEKNYILNCKKKKKKYFTTLHIQMYIFYWSFLLPVKSDVSTLISQENIGNFIFAHVILWSCYFSPSSAVFSFRAGGRQISPSIAVFFSAIFFRQK